MAFVQDYTEEEKQGQGQGQQNVITSGGSGGVITGAPASAAETTASPKTRGPSGWSNLQKYISANAGNDAQMGERIAQGIGETAQGVTQAATGLEGRAGGDIRGATVTDQGLISQLETDPTKVDKGAFTAQSTAIYQGPRDVSDYEEYGQGQQARQKLDTKLAATRTAEGQKSLLQDIAGQNYTQGLQNLDQFILSGGAQGQQALRGTQEQYGGTGSAWDALAQNLNQDIERAKQTTDTTAQATRDAYERIFGSTTEEMKKAQAKATKTSAARKSEFDKNIKELGSDNVKVRSAAAQRLGIPAATLDYLRGLGFTPQQIASYSGDVKLGDIVDPQKRAQYEALLGLADRASEFSFGATGAGPQSTAVRTDIVTAAQEAKAIRDQLERQVRDENKRRQETNKRIQDKIAKGIYDEEIAQATGLTQREYDAARYGSMSDATLGNLINERALLNMGPQGQFSEREFSRMAGIPLGVQLQMQAMGDAAAGDFATPAQQKRWAELMKVLGGKDTFSVSKKGGQGKLGFNTEAVKKAVAEVQGRIDKSVNQLRAANKAQRDARALEARLAKEEQQRREDAEAARRQQEKWQREGREVRL